MSEFVASLQILHSCPGGEGVIRTHTEHFTSEASLDDVWGWAEALCAGDYRQPGDVVIARLGPGPLA